MFVGLRPGIHSWLKLEPEDKSDVKVIKTTCQRPSLRAETSTKIWMDGLDPNYNMTRSNSGLNLRNCCRTVRAARFSLLSFGKPSWLCRSHQREHPLRGSSLNYSRFLCHLLIIQLSLYTLLTYFAHVCKLLVNLTSTTLNIPLGNENDAIESSKHHDDQKANCCNELSH